MKKLALPKIKGHGKDIYNPQHIICLEGDEGYTHLYKIVAAEPGWVKVPSITYGLGYFEEWLYDYDFQRLSKSVVANLDCVTGLVYKDDDTFITLLHNCCGHIKLGPNWRNEFYIRMLINPPDSVTPPPHTLLRNFCLQKPPFRSAKPLFR